jgi:hypothetical protein
LGTWAGRRGCGLARRGSSVLGMLFCPGERGALTWFLTGRPLRERLGWSPGLFAASQRRCAERPSVGWCLL